MKIYRILFVVGVLFLLKSFLLKAQELKSVTSNPVLKSQWVVDSVVREALVYIPQSAKKTPTPLIFVFHGRNSTMQRSRDMYLFQDLWSEAIVVYPQGLIGTGFTMLGKAYESSARWQLVPGEDNDRDLKFFDIMLDYFNKNHNIDTRRIYLTGHSNGGGFAYLLWAERPDVFAAIAPISAAMSKYSPNAFLLKKIKPKPVFIVAGETDKLVLFSWEPEIIHDILKLNKCNTKGTSVIQYLTVYDSEINNTTETYIHPGGHKPPKEVFPLMVDFFKTIDKKTIEGIK